MKTWVDTPIDELPLRTRTKNHLRRMGLRYGGDLYPLAMKDFWRVRYLGIETLRDIRNLHACPALEQFFREPC